MQTLSAEAVTRNRPRWPGSRRSWRNNRRARMFP